MCRYKSTVDMRSVHTPVKMPGLCAVENETTKYHSKALLPSNVASNLYSSTENKQKLPKGNTERNLKYTITHPQTNILL